jgi:hypothetical protein
MANFRAICRHLNWFLNSYYLIAMLSGPIFHTQRSLEYRPQMHIGHPGFSRRASHLGGMSLWRSRNLQSAPPRCMLLAGRITSPFAGWSVHVIDLPADKVELDSTFSFNRPSMTSSTSSSSSRWRSWSCLSFWVRCYFDLKRC